MNTNTHYVRKNNLEQICRIHLNKHWGSSSKKQLDPYKQGGGREIPHKWRQSVYFKEMSSNKYRRLRDVNLMKHSSKGNSLRVHKRVLLVQKNVPDLQTLLLHLQRNIQESHTIFWFNVLMGCFCTLLISHYDRQKCITYIPRIRTCFFNLTGF